MKKNLLTALLLMTCSAFSLHAQDWTNAMADGGTGDDLGYGIASDHSGNYVVTGKFTGTATFGTSPTTVTLTSAGGSDFFIAKYSASNQLLWACRGGGTGDDLGLDVVIDKAGNIYAAGSFQSTMTFACGGAGSLVAAGGQDAFLAKYDASGNVQWTKKIASSTGDDFATRLRLSPSEANVYVMGVNSNNATIWGGLFSEGGFIGNYLTSTGVCSWAYKVGARIGVGYKGAGVAVDASGNIYVSGTVRGTTNVVTGNGSSVSVTTGPQNFMAIYCKYNSSGVIQWVKSTGLSTLASTSVISALAVDGTGLYMVGAFSDGPVTIPNSGSGITLPTPPSSQSGGFIARVDQSTGNSTWAYALSTNIFLYPDIAGVSACRSVYVVTGVRTGASFSGAGGSVTYNAPSNDFVLLKYNSGGVLFWGRNTTMFSQGAVAVSGNRAFVTASLFGTRTVPTVPSSTTLVSAGNYDVMTGVLNDPTENTGTVSAPFGACVQFSGDPNFYGYFNIDQYGNGCTFTWWVYDPNVSGFITAAAFSSTYGIPVFFGVFAPNDLVIVNPPGPMIAIATLQCSCGTLTSDLTTFDCSNPLHWRQAQSTLDPAPLYALMNKKPALELSVSPNPSTDGSVKISLDAGVNTDNATLSASDYQFPNPGVAIEWNVSPSQALPSPANGTQEVRVFDAKGTDVMQEAFTGSSTTLDLSALAPGLYFIRVEGADGTVYQQRFVRL